MRALEALLRAVAQDSEMAALSGGNPARAQTLAFAAAGALAGLGATIFAAYYGGAASEFGVAGPAYQDQIFDNAIAAGGASNWTNYDGC